MTFRNDSADGSAADSMTFDLQILFRAVTIFKSLD